jgi:hypothetical protein
MLNLLLIVIVSSYSLFDYARHSIRDSPFAIRRSPFAVRRSPFAVRRSPFAVRRSPFAVRRSPFAVSLSSFVRCSPFTANPTFRHNLDLVY